MSCVKKVVLWHGKSSIQWVNSAFCKKCPVLLSTEQKFYMEISKMELNMIKILQVLCKACRLAWLILLILGPTNAW